MNQNNHTPKPTAAQRLMRLFFRLLYHPLAWSYDFVASAVSMGRWNRWVMGAIPLLTGRRVLELGYGPGHLHARLLADGYAAFGLDESRQMARQARARAVKAGQNPRLARGLAQYLPFASQQFDSVVATFPTLYIVAPETLAEVYRVLRPGGRLVVLMSAFQTGKSLRERAVVRLYKISGQLPPEDTELSAFTDPYTQAGFQASLRFVEQRDARLLFIMAVKPGTGGKIVGK